MEKPEILKQNGVFISFDVLKKKSLTLTEKIVISEIMYFESKNEFYMGSKHLAAITGLGETSIKRAINHMLEQGILHRYFRMENGSPNKRIRYLGILPKALELLP